MNGLWTSSLLIEGNSLDFRIHALIEDVFKFFTINQNHLNRRICTNCRKRKPLVYLMETADGCEKPVMDMKFSDRTYILLNSHPYRHEIIPSLLDAFYVLEMIGRLEQTSDYRRRMYEVVEQLWTLEDQKQVFKLLAVEAEQNMEAVNPSLFLRLIKILISDASYYLKEVQFYMAQLEKMKFPRVVSKNKGRRLLEQQDSVKQFIILCNILCMDTITMLEYLTEEIKTIFCHNLVLNEIAGVLIDYLIYLVGPKKNNFAIENMDEYNFDPATIVRRICAVYVNLGCNGIFRVAVGRDGRVSQLLRQAADFLMQSKSVKLSRRVRELAKQIEGTPSEAPDDFLDAITSTLMIDPVILPTSGQVVDRCTIVKWLSKNETDPYNRLPLTINMVQPDVKLKQRIEEWIKEQVRSVPRDGRINKRILKYSRENNRQQDIRICSLFQMRLP